MFEESDVRKLHIDRSQSPRVPHLTSLSPTNAGPTPSPSRGPNTSGNPTAIAHEARRFQQDITRIVKEGAPASELGALISRCHLWLKTQAPDQVTSLKCTLGCSDRLTARLIYSTKISGSASYCCTTSLRRNGSSPPRRIRSAPSAPSVKTFVANSTRRETHLVN